MAMYSCVLLMMVAVSAVSPCVEIVGRCEWQAQKTAGFTLMKIPVQYVFIHHTATTAPATTQTANAAAVRSIQTYHKGTKGWDDIGYSFLIGTDARAYEARGWARVGAHTSGKNDIGIGIALLGDFTSVMPSSSQIQAAKDLIQYGVDNGFVTSNYSVYAHRDVGNTQCPGNTFHSSVTTWSQYQLHPLP